VFSNGANVGCETVKEVESADRIDALVVVVGDDLAADFAALFFEVVDAGLSGFTDDAAGVFFGNAIDAVVVVAEQEDVGSGAFEDFVTFESVGAEIVVGFGFGLANTLAQSAVVEEVAEVDGEVGLVVFLELYECVKCVWVNHVAVSVAKG
jgi:hypothetical protein